MKLYYCIDVLGCGVLNTFRLCYHLADELRQLIALVGVFIASWTLAGHHWYAMIIFLCFVWSDSLPFGPRQNITCLQVSQSIK